ncbi:uncharacterized protein [Centruroides vittatus]|uniref:uncharacterized protein n=1 Tax=Centruroides vittatus TaxID=120091 RepID=UPI00351083C8
MFGLFLLSTFALLYIQGILIPGCNGQLNITTTMTPALETTIAGDSPTTETTAGNSSTTGTTADDSPATETTADDSPATETTADDSPGTETTADDSPGTETTANDTPATETTADDSPATETTADDSPATTILEISTTEIVTTTAETTTSIATTTQKPLIKSIVYCYICFLKEIRKKYFRLYRLVWVQNLKIWVISESEDYCDVRCAAKYTWKGKEKYIEYDVRTCPRN